MYKGRLLAASLVAVLTSISLGAEYSVPGNFATIQDALDSVAVVPGDTILVGPGDFHGAIVDKAVTIKGTGGARIVSGPLFNDISGRDQGFRILNGGNGATISHLTFTSNIFLGIYHRYEAGGSAANNVTITQCLFENNNQAITNWGGSGWEITQNKMVDLRVDNGGGIGVLVGDRFGNPDGVRDCVVSHNSITGQLNVPADDGGGYNGSGIVLYSDARYGWPGAVSISGNRVVKNKVSMTLNNLQATPSVTIVAFEMTDTKEPFGNIFFSNAIGFNDFRGTPLQIVLTPSTLDGENDISRNLGENRGQGLHPSTFGPH